MSAPGASVFPVCFAVVYRVFLGLLLAVALSGCAGLDRWERSKIYRPTALLEAQAQALAQANPGVTRLRAPVDAQGEWIDVLHAPAHGHPAQDVRVLYLHGTFRHAYQNLPKTEPMRRAGLSVYVPDYRGWGASSPRLPDEHSIHADAWTSWKFARSHAAASAGNGRPVRWIVYGHSMGSAVAARLAARLKDEGVAPCALVLESAFTSFPDVAQASLGLLGRALVSVGSQRMNASLDIVKVSGPVWFLHGKADDTVPLFLGRRLFERAPEPKHWRDWPLGHSNLHTDTTGSYDQAWRDIATGC